ncbi:MAG: flagellar assembly protein FliW [Limnochordales bacterium]|nr:MAG: flagellar assembly protein FliW [Bacillota bacterium]
MRLNTPRFGEVDVKEEDIIVFPAGILGFEHVQRYVWLEHSDDGVFHILQGVDDPAVAFVLINPLVFRPDYKVEVPPEQVAVLELDRPEEALVMAIVTVPDGDPASMTANLRAPVLFNAEKRLGCQVVMPDGPYGVRHSILAELQAAAGQESGDDAQREPRTTK